MERPSNPKVKVQSNNQMRLQIHSPSTGGCALEQYFRCSSIASRASPMTGLLRASTMAPHVGLSLIVSQVCRTCLSWRPGSLYWSLKESKVLTSTRSRRPRSYHLARHRKVSLKTVARSLMPKPETVDERKHLLIQAHKLVNQKRNCAI